MAGMALGKLSKKTPKTMGEVTSKSKVSSPKTKLKAAQTNVGSAEAVTAKSRKKSAAGVNVESPLRDSVIVHPASETKAMAAAAGAGEHTTLFPHLAGTNGSPYVSRGVTREQIEHLAYQYWVERGFTHGSAEEDWNRAEAELRRRY